MSLDDVKAAIAAKFPDHWSEESCEMMADAALDAIKESGYTVTKATKTTAKKTQQPKRGR